MTDISSDEEVEDSPPDPDALGLIPVVEVPEEVEEDDNGNG